MNTRIRYTCAGYKHAPESFIAYRVLIDSSGGSNHSYQKINLTQEQAREVGYCCVTKGKEEAEKMIKRIVREYEKKQRTRRTYGFFTIESPTDYLFSRSQLCYSDAPMETRFRLYKRLKDFFRTEQHIIAQTATLDGNYRVKTVKEDVYTADVSRPLIIRFKKIDELYEN